MTAQKTFTSAEIKAHFAKKKRATPEADLQEQVVTWFRAKYPTVMIFSIPNGQKRTWFERKEAKRTGMVAGVPDLFIAKARQLGGGTVAHGLFIELKNGKAGKVSEAQEQVMEYLSCAVYDCFVCRNFTEAKTIIDNYLTT